jgi:serine/threonine protein kinase
MLQGAPGTGGAMPEPSTAEEFLELACKSGVLDPQQLQRRKAAGPLPEAPRALSNVLVRDGLLTRFQAEQLLRGRWRNFILSGKYKILGPLGSGGMGHVYLCEHQIMRRRVAIKVLPGRRANDPEALERFRREARAVAQLNHPNIVQGFDIDRDGAVHFLVMEYVDGSTLYNIVKKHGPMDLDRATHYIRQAALGLQHAHEAGLVHRDIKPSNVLLDRTGTIKILDLGLARFFHDEDDDLSKRHVDSPLGTTDYMAPEQALDSHQADIRADIYSLGVTFYFLLAGHGPFQKGSPLQKLIRHQIEPPQPIQELRPDVPEEVATILERMMHKDPAERYQTPVEVVTALTAWTQTPPPPPPPEEMPKLATPARGAIDAGAAPGAPASLYESAPSTVAPPPKVDGAATPPGVVANGPMSPDPEKSPPPLVERAAAPPASPTTFTASRPQAVPPGPPLPSPPVAAEEVGARAGPVSTVPFRLPTSTAGESPQPRWTPARRRRLVGVLAAAGVLLVGAGIAGFALFHKGTDTAVRAPGASPQRLRLLVPAYFYPGGEGLAEWERLMDSPAAAFTVAIVNVASGPGKEVDPNYSKILEGARRKGVTVIGYVSTQYAKEPLQKVRGEVDRWISLYPDIQGIFFDEQASSVDHVLYYAALYEYVRKDKGLSLVVTDPGAVCAEEYFVRQATDTACLVEVVKEFSDYRRPSWAERYSAERFAALLCQVGTLEQMQQYVTEMQAKRIGYCYITDAKGANPWSRLPRYWDAEVEAIQQANASK